ncbi:DUF262 domain-containing protein [Sinorhizobium saheli]|uniref:DUF262 domain-containing protein n=1 Tax=Sinorhizobium saheli TaxID=36856 RepID=UPI001297ACEE|nr:DUF262 domain-containing protein [Sinorhizobium saheli]MQW85997.1 DUF262 domain-containing protein [Sinorhizobium saheli]
MAAIEKIHSDLLGIGKLLKQSRFSVPPHQRPYAWGDTQIQDLFRDINDAKTRKGNEEYFLGTVVLASGDDGRNSIIDGQQRLVTTSILIASIRDYFVGKAQEQRAQDITQEYLSKRDIRTQAETAYLHLVPEDRDFFLKRVVLPPGHQDRGVESVSQAQQRIEQAILLAKQFVDSLTATTQSPDDVLLDLLEFIDGKALVISVKVGDEANAYVIFEVLNDRGLDLSVADLLKNYIFRVAGERLPEAQTAWSQMTTAITDVAEEPDVRSFIRQAWISDNGLTREKQLYDAIKRHVGSNPSKAVEYAKRLAKQAVTYAALNNSSHARWKDYNDNVAEALEVFTNVGVTQIRPLLISVFEHFDVEQVNKTIPMMVSWTVRFLISGSGGSGTLEQYYSDRAKEISDGTITKATQLYDAMKAVLPSDQTFREAFSTATVNKGWIAKFYLRVLESAENAKDNELIVNPDPGKVNLEHILPQTHKADVWPQFTADEHKAYVRRIGNMALLNKRMNTKIANSDFQVKKPILEASAIELTKKAGQNPDWTKQIIDDRQRLLADLAVKAWPNRPQDPNA